MDFTLYKRSFADEILIVGEQEIKHHDGVLADPVKPCITVPLADASEPYLEEYIYVSSRFWSQAEEVTAGKYYNAALQAVGGRDKVKEILERLYKEGKELI